MSLKRALLALRPQLAQAANAILQEWQQDDEGYDETYGSGGVCDAIASAFSDVIGNNIPEAAIADYGHDGDDHASIVVRMGREVYGVDVPPEVYESGGGLTWRKTAEEIGPGDVAIFQSYWPDDQEYDEMLPEAIEQKIEEGTITAEDINALIETSYKSANERVLRRLRTRDSNEGHDDEGHAGPAQIGARVAPRRGGGKLNDPTRTARGRRAVTRKENKEDPRVLEIAEEWYRPDGSPKTRIMTFNLANKVAEKYKISIKEACELLDQTDKLLGKGLVGGGTHWESVKGFMEKRGLKLENEVPKAGFVSKKLYEPVCPHCGKIMYEKHCVPDQASLGEGKSLYRHRGECYDKGAFVVEWPQSVGFVKESKESPKFKQAAALIKKHAPIADIYNVYWNKAKSSIYVSNGDWAEYDTDALYKALEKLLGKGKVSMEAEGHPPDDDPEWERIELDTKSVEEHYGRFTEATKFILENRGKDIKLDRINDKDTLRKLTARLLTVEKKDRSWLYDLYRRLED